MMKVQSPQFKSSSTRHGGWRVTALTLLVVSVLTIFSSCSDNDSHTDHKPEIKGTITGYNEFGAAMLSFLEQDMKEAGFDLGDLVTITVAGKQIDMPYYDGFYTRNGDYLCVAYPTYPSICFTANNIGVPQELRGLEGKPVVITMKEKAANLDVQTALGMKYTYLREDYPSDEAFANARAVKAGRIVEGRLHRTSSPFCNDINRAQYVSEYLERQQVKTVLNLADTEDKMLDYYDVMPPYSKKLWDDGSVILCPLKSDPTADEFNNRLIEALKELPSHPAPYVVHCMEGKDRTGYVCALLEGLCGATYDEIVADYLKTYDNFYKITPEKDGALCIVLVSLRLAPCLMHYAGIENDDESQLPTIDYAMAFSNYLLSHGMSQQQLDALIKVLTDPNP